MCAAPGSKVTDQLLDQFAYLIRTQDSSATRSITRKRYCHCDINTPRPPHRQRQRFQTIPSSHSPIRPPSQSRFHGHQSGRFNLSGPSVDDGRKTPLGQKYAESTLVRPYPLRRAVQRRWHAAKEHWHLETLATLRWERSAWVRFCHKTSEHASPLTTFSKASGSYPSTRHAYDRAGRSHRLLHLFPEPGRKRSCHRRRSEFSSR